MSSPSFLQDVVTTHKEKFLRLHMVVKDHNLDAFYLKYLEGRSSFSNVTEALKRILTHVWNMDLA